MNDSQLLQTFVMNRDADAFRQIVERYADLVYAAARRQVGAGHLAEDVAQAVFLILSQKARTVHGGAGLAGWLVNTTRLAALSAARSERRLKRRENKVAAMSPIHDAAADGKEFQSIAPLLDAAMARLGAADRTAVTLRYLKQMTLAEVAATMAISEAAASKRVNRAVAKLRQHFSRHGVDIPLGSVGAAILQNGAGAAPAGFAVRATSAALENPMASIGASTPIAHVIVKGTLTAMKIKQAITAAAIVVALLVLGGSVWFAMHELGGGNSKIASAPASQPAPASPGEPDWMAALKLRGPIKVGVILSDFTANTRIGSDAPFGYVNQLRILPELRDTGIECCPVIEPGTETSPALATILNRDFAGKIPVNGYDAVALGQLDVIAGSQLFALRDEMISAITDAVSSGTGLLYRQAFGDSLPGYSTEILRLHGLEQADFGKDLPWRKPISCEIVGDHPILGSLAGRHGAILDTMPIGAFGILGADATPLIRVRAIREINPDRPSPPPVQWSFYPLYIVRLGRGQIIACNFNIAAPPSRQLLGATGGKFTVRCVQWLAWQRDQAAATSTQPAVAPDNHP
ncbi:MAG TPA: sigma-70 family RNA polymerase sigma factor [Tepidisphaeraceae bacterium]